MGLDMYLSCKVKNVETPDELYWRKANAIHKWFVDNCQNGNDDCESYEVSIDQLKTLINVCERVQSNRSEASEFLPTASGFFFGGTDYDPGYFTNIEFTITELRNLCNKYNNRDDVQFFYHSSW